MGTKPSGADLFVHDVQLLPDNLFLWMTLCKALRFCAALRCTFNVFDMRIVAYNIVRNDVLYIANKIKLIGE